METLSIKEKVFYGKSGKPESVLLDYKTFSQMVDLIEDAECIKIIRNREKEAVHSEEEFRKKLSLP